MPSPEPPNVRLAIPAFAPGVRDAVYRHVYRDPANELGGLLVGDRRELGSVIVGAIEATGARGDVTSLTFTQDAWASMLGELDTRYPGAEVLGWYHSHPGHGVFLSAHDRFIHQHFFSAAWQVAVVVDPQRHHEGLFMWHGPELDLVAEAGVDPTWATSAAASSGPGAPAMAPPAPAPPAPAPTPAAPAPAPAPAPMPPPDPRTRGVSSAPAPPTAHEPAPESPDASPPASTPIDDEDALDIGLDHRAAELRRIRARRMARERERRTTRRRGLARLAALIALLGGIGTVVVALF